MKTPFTFLLFLLFTVGILFPEMKAVTRIIPPAELETVDQAMDGLTARQAKRFDRLVKKLERRQARKQQKGIILSIAAGLLGIGLALVVVGLIVVLIGIFVPVLLVIGLVAAVVGLLCGILGFIF